MASFELKNPEIALSIDSLTKSYGSNVVVDSLSLEIKKGEFFALLGPNGAGKSTTLNSTVGLVKKDHGTIKVFGDDTENAPLKSRRLVGLMHQEIIFDNFFTIRKSLDIHAGYQGIRIDPEWREHILKKLALIDHAEKKPLQLSGGMKRRLMMAKALIHKPPLLILDEPTAGVDVELRHALWDFIEELRTELNMTVLLTTHYLEEAEKLCEKIAIIDAGKIVALESTQDLLKNRDGKTSKLEDVFLKLVKKKDIQP